MGARTSEQTTLSTCRSLSPARRRSHPEFTRWARTLPAILLVAVATLAVGCASGDDSAPATSDEAAGVTSGGFGSSESTKGDAGGSSPSGAPALGGDGGGSVALPSSLNRTIIRNGSIEMTVDSVSESFDRVRNLAEAAGGFVADSSFRGTEEQQSANLTLRVPAGRFGDIVASLQKLAVEVRSITSGSNDVTDEYTDLESSLRSLRAVEQQYLTLLGEAKTINDILVVQDRLNGVRSDLERVQGRLNLLGNLAELATINVSLHPVPAEPEPEPEPEKDGFVDQVSDAWNSSLETLAAVGTGIAVVLVWSWWLIPVLAVLAVVARRYSTRQRTMERIRDTARATERVDTPESDT